jgi:hypothetical protein
VLSVAAVLGRSDMTTIVWDLSKREPLVQRFEDHTEFVVGLDFSICSALSSSPSSSSSFTAFP